MKTLVIIGTGGFGREVLWAAQEDNSLQFVEFVFVDDSSEIHNTVVCNASVVGTIEHVPKVFAGKEGIGFVCGVGSPRLRKEFVSRVQKLPSSFSTFFPVIHRSVNMSPFVSVGEGSVLCAGNNLTTQISIGKHVNLNLDCTVGHDCVIEDFVNISPGVHISGYCTLKEGCDIGTGVNIVPHVTIGEGAIIGAGACVTKDIPPYTLAVGIPAVVKKNLL